VVFEGEEETAFQSTINTDHHYEGISSLMNDDHPTEHLENHKNHEPSASYRPVLVYPYLNRRGGVERYLCELIDALKRIGLSDVGVVTGQVDNKLAQSYSPRKLPFLPKPYFLSSLSFCLASLFLKRSRNEVYHAQGASDFLADLVTAQSVHKSWFLRSLKELHPGQWRWWLKIFNPTHYASILIETFQFKIRPVRKVVAISKLVRDEIHEYYSYPLDRIQVIYSGVNCEEFCPRISERFRDSMRQTLGYMDSDFVMIFVANEFRRKGLQTIFQAMTLLSDQKIRLLVVGKDNPVHFQSMAHNLGILDQVQFLGSRSDLNQLYGASDCFVFPTQYEAFGLVITEAMASGLPVVVSAQAGAAELIEDGVDGLLLQNPRDANELATKLQSLEQKARRNEISLAARKKALQFTWDHLAFQHKSLYEELTGGGKITAIGEV
jgi:UDP-glucose:(heptosyl)LPS alpha-1,3-glucosyltransferase